MKHIKLFENFDDQILDKYNKMLVDIDSICEKCGIKNYTINDDETIDVDGVVNLSDMGLTKLPLRFRNVSGHFNCGYNQLITLEGSPQEVGGDFNCSYNELTSLEGGPQKVGRTFDCYNNQLTSLEGAPQVVGRNFYCNDNQLTSLEGAPQKVGRNFTCSQNPVEVIWNLFKDYSMIDLFNDYDPIRDDKVIVLDRLNSFLKDIGKPTVTEVKGYKCI